MKKSTESKIKAVNTSWKRLVEELKSSPKYKDLKNDILNMYEVVEKYGDFLEEEDYL